MIRRYPAVYLLVFIVLGTVLADRSHLPAWAFLAVTLIAGVAGLFALARLRLISAMVLLAVGIGAFTGFHFASSYYDTGPRHLSRFLSEPSVYHVFGRVSDWPDLKPNRSGARERLR
jgi:O-antigen ligase